MHLYETQRQDHEAQEERRAWEDDYIMRTGGYTELYLPWSPPAYDCGLCDARYEFGPADIHEPMAAAGWAKVADGWHDYAHPHHPALTVRGQALQWACPDCMANIVPGRSNLLVVDPYHTENPALPWALATGKEQTE